MMRADVHFFYYIVYMPFIYTSIIDTVRTQIHTWSILFVLNKILSTDSGCCSYIKERQCVDVVTLMTELLYISQAISDVEMVYKWIVL